jgi:hypothetical protein
VGRGYFTSPVRTGSPGVATMWSRSQVTEVRCRCRAAAGR